VTDRTTTPETPATTAGALGAPNSERRPGEWPPCPYTDELLRQQLRERARRELTLGSVRAALEEEPTPWCVRAAARRWCSQIAGIAEDIAKDMEDAT
jgi:hypothetical protein